MSLAFTEQELDRLSNDELAELSKTATRLLLSRATTQAIGPDTLLSISESARIAATTPRVLKDAIRAGELAAYGGQRDRSVRKGDLDKWIESRRFKPSPIDVDDRDLELRMARLRRERATAGGAR